LNVRLERAHTRPGYKEEMRETVKEQEKKWTEATTFNPTYRGFVQLRHIYTKKLEEILFYRVRKEEVMATIFESTEQVMTDAVDIFEPLQETFNDMRGWTSNDDIKVYIEDREKE